MPGMAQCRVVIIDDNEDAAFSLGDLLELEGHEAYIALNGRDGIHAVLSRRPDVVLCDLGLPDLDGLAVGRLLRREVGRGMTLVALTGFASAEYERQAIAAGFDYHLPKPLDLEVLSSILALAAEARGAQQSPSPTPAP